MQETVFPRLCMPRGHLEVSGDIFGCCHWNGRVLLAISGWGSGTLLNPQQRIGQAAPTVEEDLAPNVSSTKAG